jgi:hypothetical protein
VKGKAFLFMSTGKGGDGIFSLSVKLPVSGKVALSLPFASPTEYGLGKSGWVAARFQAKDEVPIDVLMEWVDESFRAIAPKRLLAMLEGDQANALTKRTPLCDGEGGPQRRDASLGQTGDIATRRRTGNIPSNPAETESACGPAKFAYTDHYKVFLDSAQEGWR